LVEFRERSNRCCVAVRNQDVDGFLEWPGPEGTFIGEDGSLSTIEENRHFQNGRVSAHRPIPWA
jgi:hypothetical protein